MSMNSSDFKTKIATEINAVNGNCPIVGTQQLQGFAQGGIMELNAATVTYSDFPLYEVGGIITGMIGSNLANNVKTIGGYPFVSAKLLALCTAIVTHWLTGICNYGSIDGYSTGTLASMIASALGVFVTPEITALAKGLVEYVTDNADVDTGSPIIIGAIS